MYAHPRHLDDALLDVLAGDARFCPYLDIPLQHATDRMLGLMGRGMDAAATRAVLARVRTRWPAAALRTAFIVGHPGETQTDFAALCDFVAEGHFLHAGVFAYSPEAGTPSASLDGAVPPAVAAERRDALMGLQREVSRRLLAKWVGREVEVLVDGPAPGVPGRPAEARAAGRVREQAPEVDGATWLAGRAARGLRPGTLLRARVSASRDYDLVAEPADSAG